MATRILASVVSVSLFSLIVATFVGVNTGRSLGKSLNDDRLVALRSAGVFDVAAEMRALANTANTLASSPQAAMSLESFAAAHAELSEIPSSGLVDEVEALVLEYRIRYLDPLQAVGSDLNLRDIVPRNSAAVYLQSHYAVDLGVIDEPAAVDDALDGSRWSEVHSVVHPVYRDVVDRMGLFDLYLVEPDTGFIVYSVNKRPDIGTSLDLGPFSGSFLATLVDEVRDDPSAGTTISDFSFYDPAGLTPVGAIASPIMDGERLVGVLVLMYDSSRINEVLTAGGNWDDGGFPPTGESYLIGEDGLIRSDPRSFLEDPQGHLKASVEAGILSEADRLLIGAVGSTVLIQPVIGQTTDAGTEGNLSVTTSQTMVGGWAFSTVEEVDVAGVSWFVVTEVGVEAAEGGLDEFTDLLVVGTAIFIIVLAFLAVAWATRIVRPIRAVSERLGSHGAELGPVGVDAKTPIEFCQLAESFEAMSSALQEQQAQLASARDEKLRLLRRMLPAEVADRVVAGDLQSVEEVSKVTFVVLVVLGLGELIRIDGGDSGREVVDRLHSELDNLAERHGVERVKVIGDAYFAACGHARPYIDHAPRAYRFARDAQDAILEIGSEVLSGLELSSGIDTGPVTVGVSAQKRLLYDVWGEPATVAHYLARRASPGQILVSNEAAVLLPESVELTRPPGSDADLEWAASEILERGPV